MIKKVLIFDEWFEPYEFWKNFSCYIYELMDTKVRIDNSFDRTVEFHNQLNKELRKYHAKFLFTEMTVEFETEQDATLFLLKWS